MDYLFPVIIIYFIALAINVLILRCDVMGIDGLVSMLAYPAHGILSNTIAKVIIFFPPITFFLLIVIAIKNKTKKS